MNDHRIIVATAPGRAGIIGNPSDMYGGAVISCSLPMRAKVTITPDSELTLVAYGKICHIRKRDDLELKKDWFDIARVVLTYLGLPERPCRVEYETTVPIQSGLSGSTALVVALLQGLLAWQDEYPNRYQLAEKARYIEFNYLKVVCGFQDAYMCAFGGLNYLDFRSKQFDQAAEAKVFASVESLNSRSQETNKHLPFILATTGVRRDSGAVHKPLGERWLEGEPAVVEGYKRISELAQLGKSAFLNSDWEQLGKLMNQNHVIQRELGGSGESNERLIAAAVEAGAPGAKLAGAGKGGTIIALWPDEDTTSLEMALRRAGAVAFYRPTIQAGATIEEEPGIKRTE